MQGSRSPTSSASGVRRAGRRPRPARSPRRRRRGRARASRAGPKSASGRMRDLGAEVGAQGVVGLGGVGEERDAAVGVQDREGERHRRPGDVGAADVEEPGDRVGQREHRGGEVAGDEAAGDLGALLGRGAAGERVRVGDDRRAPAAAAGRARRASTRFATRTRPICRGPSAASRPSISLAVCSQGSKPRRPPPGSTSTSQSAGLSSGMAQDGEEAGVDLILHLQPVAAVDEDAGAVAGDDRHAGRAGEAGEPGEPLVARGARSRPGGRRRAARGRRRRRPPPSRRAGPPAARAPVSGVVRRRKSWNIGRPSAATRCHTLHDRGWLRAG